jgi:hypothetical protein
MNLYQNDIFIDAQELTQSMSSKLFTTFITVEKLEETIQEITHKYEILFNKIFVLEVTGKDEIICTYNVDSFNISNSVLPNTILLHRKKETNTLYSINSLNALIQELNEGKIDNRYPVPWENYQNSILLVNDNVLKVFPTKIYKIIHL